MPTFPLLKTGAITQYPLLRMAVYRTRVHRFVDGSEQRYPLQGPAIKRWRVRLTELDESELGSLREFFSVIQGRFATFTFTDPTDGALYLNCFLEQDSLAADYLHEFHHNTVFVIRSQGG